MLFDHVIIRNLLIHLVLWALSIKSSQRLLCKANVASGGRDSQILPLYALDIFPADVTTITVHLH